MKVMVYRPHHGSLWSNKKVLSKYGLYWNGTDHSYCGQINDDDYMRLLLYCRFHGLVLKCEDDFGQRRNVILKKM